jgi:hypothetical protein
VKTNAKNKKTALQKCITAFASIKNPRKINNKLVFEKNIWRYQYAGKQCNR